MPFAAGWRTTCPRRPLLTPRQAMSLTDHSPLGGITFYHPGAFWAGTVAVTVGVILHLPMYLGARDMHYLLAGMPMSPGMITGMVLILAGFAATFYGLVPPPGRTGGGAAARIRVQALDEAPLNKAHLGL